MKPPLIKTQFTYPPIPSRAFDWHAWVDGDEEGVIGHGASEAEALAHLREQLEDEVTSPDVRSQASTGDPRRSWDLELRPETGQDRENLKAALLDLGRANYENLRADLIRRLGYDQFRDLQNSIFKEIGTIEFEEGGAPHE